MTGHARKRMECQVDDKERGHSEKMTEDPHTLSSRLASHSYPRLPTRCRVQVNWWPEFGALWRFSPIRGDGGIRYRGKA